MRFLYHSSVYFYAFAIHLAAPFNPKAKAWVQGRKQWLRNLPKEIGSNVVWFHCASLGEYDMALPVMRLLKENDPSIFLLVTFFSPSGMQHFHKRNFAVDFATYLPIDTATNAHRFIAHFAPKKAFFVKYEFWANYINEAKKQACKVYSLSSVFREKHIFFKWYGGFFRATLKQIDYFFTQNDTSTQLLATIGIKQAATFGDTRFDRVIENASLTVRNEQIEHFLGNEKAIVLGSTWKADEDILIPFILANPQQKFILAPHTIDEQHLQRIEKQLQGRSFRYTNTVDSTSHVLILNTIGHLASAYSYGKIAYVGGGFSGNLHNILEPAVFGLPVLFGPKHSRFLEAEQFINAGIGYAVSTTDEVIKTVAILNDDLTRIAQNTVEFVQKNKGAAQRVVDYLTLS